MKPASAFKKQRLLLKLFSPSEAQTSQKTTVKINCIATDKKYLEVYG
jgi:hypothetical protein